MKWAKNSYDVGAWELLLFSQVGTGCEMQRDGRIKSTNGKKSYDLMKHFEILASLYFRYGLLQQAEGLAVAVCFLLAAGIFLWRMWRYLKKDNDKELEREHHGD